MKAIIGKISAVAMMGILFIVTAGFNVFSHMCFMDGAKEISTAEISSCCAIEPVHADYKFSTKCCDDEVHFIKLDLTTVVAKYQVQQVAVPVIEFTGIAFICEENNFSSDLIFDQLPPPKSGREILTTNSVFRI